MIDLKQGDLNRENWIESIHLVVENDHTEDLVRTRKGANTNGNNDDTRDVNPDERLSRRGIDKQMRPRENNRSQSNEQ